MNRLEQPHAFLFAKMLVTPAIDEKVLASGMRSKMLDERGRSRETHDVQIDTDSQLR